ncbi:MAG: hypothetical protein RRY78_02420, partial [Clostridia bacterium]
KRADLSLEDFFLSITNEIPVSEMHEDNNIFEMNASDNIDNTNKNIKVNVDIESENAENNKENVDNASENAENNKENVEADKKDDVR